MMQSGDNDDHIGSLVVLYKIAFPPLPSILSPPSPVLSPAPPPSPIRSLGYRAAMIRLRAEAASTSHSPPLPSSFILSPTRLDAPSSGIPLLLPISILLHHHHYNYPLLVAGRTDPRPAGGLRADYDFVATMNREIMRDPEREVGYGITDSWDEIVEALQRAPVSTDTELGRYMREFETRVRQDTEEIYMRREIVISDLLRADHRRSIEIIRLRTALQGQGLAEGLTQPELPEEAGSGS
nr:hypothetical protein [Tanacetum cinerariifolium]